MLCKDNAFLLERLMVNLVDNALKHGLPPVVLSVTSTDGGGAVVAVIDSGQGLPLGSHAQLQEAFARGNSRQSVPGAGLGSAITKLVLSGTNGHFCFEQRDQQHRVLVTVPRAG